MSFGDLSKFNLESITQMVKNIDVSAIPPSVKLLFIIIEIIAVIVAAGFIFIIPILNKIQASDANRESLIATYVAQKKEGQSLSKYEAYLSQLKAKYKKAILLSPKDSEIEFILREINVIGVKNKIVFNSFQPGAETIQGVYIMLPIVVSMSGKFEDFSKFCYELTKINRLISIEDVEIKKDEKGVDQDSVENNILKFSFVVKVYRYQKNATETQD